MATVMNKLIRFGGYMKEHLLTIRATLSSQEGFCHTDDGIMINIFENKK